MIKKKFFLLVAFIIILIIAYKFNKNNKKPFTLPSSNFTSTTTSTSKTGRLLPRQISSSPVTAQTTIPQNTQINSSPVTAQTTTTIRPRLIISKNINLPPPGVNYTNVQRYGEIHISPLFKSLPGVIQTTSTDPTTILSNIQTYLFDNVNLIPAQLVNKPYNYINYYKNIGGFKLYYSTIPPKTTSSNTNVFNYKISGIARFPLTPEAKAAVDAEKIATRTLTTSKYVSSIILDYSDNPIQGSTYLYNNNGKFLVVANPGQITANLSEPDEIVRQVNNKLLDVASFGDMSVNLLGKEYNYILYDKSGGFFKLFNFNIVNDYKPRFFPVKGSNIYELKINLKIPTIEDVQAHKNQQQKH